MAARWSMAPTVLLLIAVLSTRGFGQPLEDGPLNLPTRTSSGADHGYSSRESVIVFNVGTLNETGGTWRNRFGATTCGSRFSFDPGPGASMNPIAIYGIGLAFDMLTTGSPDDSTVGYRVRFYLDPMEGPPIDPLNLPAEPDATIVGTLVNFVSPGFFSVQSGTPEAVNPPVVLGNSIRKTSGFYTIEALVAGTNIKHPSAGPSLRGNVTPNPGSSDGVRWADANNDGVVQASELLGSLTTVPRIAYLNMSTSIGPPPCVPPELVSPPVSQEVCTGTPVTLEARFSGTSLALQWRRDGVPIPGANSAELRFTAAQPTDDGTYDCVAINTCGTATTSAVTLSVTPLFEVATQPIDQSVVVDGPVSFVVQMQPIDACSTSITYQWQRRDPTVQNDNAPNAWIDLVDGPRFLHADSSGLIIVKPIPALATGYRCKIGGGCGCRPTGGFIYSNTVNFTIACPADFNADGGIDFGDIEAFFERWENGC